MARLRHVSSSEPGLARRRYGRGFVYLDERGRRVRGIERAVRDLLPSH